jgi:hypothetical protein
MALKTPPESEVREGLALQGRVARGLHTTFVHQFYPKDSPKLTYCTRYSQGEADYVLGGSASCPPWPPF